MSECLSDIVGACGRYIAGVAGLRKGLVGEELALERIIYYGKMSGECDESIREELTALGVKTSDIDLELEKHKQRIAAKTPPSADETEFVRTSIARGGHHRTLTDLAKASPAPIPLSIRGQRQSTGQILYLDWRWENPTENPARIHTPINQRAEDPRWTAHLRFVTVSFPLLDLEVQTALWLGIIASQKLRIRLILLILNDRLGFGYLEAVIRLAECDNRVPGGVPGEMVCEDRLTKRDFEFQREQADELKRLLQSDPDPKYRCASVGLDPLNRILLPGNDGNGTSSTVIWAARPDFDNDMLF